MRFSKTKGFRRRLQLEKMFTNGQASTPAEQSNVVYARIRD